ncbi:uncharacterized protein MELLADRAFT_92562 [Melampsora larici-populina 98AG31]|uniref:Uncharacterized protein n=1 Tax=Melampsora larici-populina (strain 98AG31 / pathotype 3-4-7) TaxID=747676 RepID=F4S201_MELLP|nr:uncharacterized protein MELLADRAFT_92562 [Melampsora larici-populina 98AG31]EGG01350.1 hypothetical protein MELLADRAFT_92562 [Melampsora larici-populina 98AG31]
MSTDNNPQAGIPPSEGTPNPITEGTPTNNNTPTNTETFHAMMRRSSSRLRGGSVPPPDSEVITPSSMATIQRGRGRGRGRRNVEGPTRTGTNTPSTPVVTLTVPDQTLTSTPAGNRTAAPTQDSASMNAIAQGGVGTSVIHTSTRTPAAEGLVSRDEVSNGALSMPHNMCCHVLREASN